MSRVGGGQVRRLPVVATLIVLAAVAAMVGLGVWQLRRAVWKEALLARYAAAQGQPLLNEVPAVAKTDPDRFAFRRASVTCDAQLAGHTELQIGGRNRAGATGYRHIAMCAAGGGSIMLDIGWSAPATSVRNGTSVSECRGPCETRSFVGRLIPDPQLARRLEEKETGRHFAIVPLLLVAERTESPLEPSVPPAIADIPNNHRAYAVQWFLFAAVALVVYVLALRRRAR